ncbi:glutathione peroxidase [bacterium]|nr:MAG: glutathione peroxidase [bacterium]
MAPAKFYDFKAVDIDGKPVALKKYKGKVVMVVNVASKCGNTPQYEGLEKLYKEYKSKGLVILGFPANEFGAQEPGTEAEIKQFCTSLYGVDFPMMSKVVVKGEGQAPLFKWLVENSDRPTEPIEWNFAKFIVGRDGKVFKRIKPQVKPETPEVRQAIEDALAAK